jgi:arsenate reductase (glutaredoxin)
MEEIIIYEKPTCSKCRIALRMLDEHGVPYRDVRYHDAPITKKKLAELVKKIGITPAELLRKEDPVYKKLHVKPETLKDAEIIELMITHPDLMQRPILERGDRAILGRPSERVLEFLQET